MDDAGWEASWRRRLLRLHLGAEPLAEQLARLRRVTWALTVVPGLIGLMFVALFAAFGAPGYGLAIAAVLFGPVIGIAWLDDWRIHRLAARYESERRARESGVQARNTASSSSS